MSRMSGAWFSLFSFLSLILLVGFSSQPGLASGPPTNDPLASAMISNYCVILQAGYEDTLKLARGLDTAIGHFLENPNAERLRAAREAWSRCRAIYIQTEVARFCDGPIETVE